MPKFCRNDGSSGGKKSKSKSKVKAKSKKNSPVSVWFSLVALSWLTCFGLITLSVLSQHWIIIWLLIWFQMASLVHGAQTETPFPDISFSAFTQIIESTFGSNISLATVLTLLFTITENVDLLNLHFQQQHPEFQGENKTQTTGLMIALARALIDQLGSYNDEDEDDSTPHDKVKLVAGKLNDMAVSLNLTPYDDQDAYIGKLLPVSQKAIQPVHMICPGSLIMNTFFMSLVELSNQSEFTSTQQIIWKLAVTTLAKQWFRQAFQERNSLSLFRRVLYDADRYAYFSEVDMDWYTAEYVVLTSREFKLFSACSDIPLNVQQHTMARIKRSHRLFNDGGCNNYHTLFVPLKRSQSRGQSPHSFGKPRRCYGLGGEWRRQLCTEVSLGIVQFFTSPFVSGTESSDLKAPFTDAQNHLVGKQVIQSNLQDCLSSALATNLPHPDYHRTVTPIPAALWREDYLYMVPLEKYTKSYTAHSITNTTACKSYWAYINLE
ncbi:uncharacterized protein LACBIDRAFT_331901 [Laccaria bicolor S238N-H82]|uniref:Predicted protein n=1 Tax=Laccaria bicolor (strain S238N-H82 / ATCC MYA-4686) TaxID=486041 RepID=B0DQZ3_LACBS|nr:uncharacterized protein LACBIDRAFT_331901 [Laccaria bicolor S238N-H82]EDR02974.1 predicted protein [Laccaria bicolor S238N-H82]|eukprot:XP_001886397.1 predicted protein [Laccaria bicolor S238N-H82]